MEINRQYDENPTHEGERKERQAAEIAYFQREKLRPFGQHLLDSLGTLERSAKIALKQFPPLGRGERVGVKEIKQRLSALRNQGGYDVPVYSHMNRDEAWNTLRNIQSGLWKALEIYLPEVLEEVIDYRRPSH